MDKDGINDAIVQSPIGPAYEMISLFSDSSWAQRLTMAVWAASTHTYRTFGAHPRLYFCADGPASGKTANMQATTAMCANPLNIGYASQAAVYSWLEAHPDTTFGLDEIDKAFGSDGRKTSRAILASVVNDGYLKKGMVLVNRGTKATRMPVYAPVAMAGIGTLPADTLTRCIPIKLRKGRPEMQFVPGPYDSDMEGIGDDLREWLQTEDSQEFLASQSRLPDFEKVDDTRTRQILAPLLAICELAGIAEIFRIAVTEVYTGISANPPEPMHAHFFRDLRSIWPEDCKMLSSAQIISALREHPSERWRGLTPGRLGDVRVAGYMRQRGLESRVSAGARGYTRREVFAAS